MAIYHFSGQMISRSQGRSSVAAAAYRAAERIVDERTFITHNYAKKQHDIIYQVILAPPNTKENLLDRAKLWNTVESTEKRKDAQLAREFNISLPLELTNEQNIVLAKEFVESQFVSQGMVADLCIHQGGKGDKAQPHAHVLLTLRDVNDHGDGFGVKNRSWNSKAHLQNWREQWTDCMNRHLALNGYDLKVDHRTLAAQEIDLEPQNKIGAASAYRYMARFAEHQEIAYQNGERLLAQPETVLHALTCQQSTFTKSDIARFINRHSINQEQFTRIMAKVMHLPELIALGHSEMTSMRYSTKEIVDLETKLINQALIKAQKSDHALSFEKQHNVELFNTLTKGQKIALQFMTGRDDFCCVIGYAGTGKSYMLNVARQAWEEAGYHVHGMTLSGIAAQNLESSSGIASNTVANRRINWLHDREKLTQKDIVIVDEAGMLGSRDLAAIVDEADRANAKVVLIGDTKQLQPIAAGAPFRALQAQLDTPILKDIRRQHIKWQQDATKSMAECNVQQALNAYDKHGCLHEYTHQSMAMDAMVEKWNQDRQSCCYPLENERLMLAYTNKEVSYLNRQAREYLKQDGTLDKFEEEFLTTKGKKSFTANDRICFLQNERHHLNVRNGSIGVIESINNTEFVVQVKDPSGDHRAVSFDINDYNAITHGYAVTIHKAQGSTVDHTYLLTSDYFNHHLAYVGLSRHRKGIDIYCAQDQFQCRSMVEQLSIQAHKDCSTDYNDGRFHSTLIEQSSTQEAYHEDRVYDEKTLSCEAFFNKYYDNNESSQHDINHAVTSDQSHNQINQHRQNAFNEAISTLEYNTNKKAIFDLEDGLSGIYRGSADLAGERYGMIELKHKELAMVPYENCYQLKTGRSAVVREYLDKDTQETGYFAEKHGCEVEKCDIKREIAQNNKHKIKNIEMELEM